MLHIPAGTLKFLFNTLKAKEGPIARELYERLKFRVNQRRKTDLVSLIKYLHNKEMRGTVELPLSSKKTCHTLLFKLFYRLFRNDCRIEHPAVDVDENEETEIEGESLTKQLQRAIEQEIQPVTTVNSDAVNSVSYADIVKLLKHELTGYEKSFVLGENLQKMLAALKTIQPTSTESERVFSLAAHICTKRRVRLSDRSLNNICFLKSYFLRKQHAK